MWTALTLELGEMFQGLEVHERRPDPSAFIYEEGLVIRRCVVCDGLIEGRGNKYCGGRDPKTRKGRCTKKAARKAKVSCGGCGKGFKPRRKNQVHCSRACVARAYRRRLTSDTGGK